MSYPPPPTPADDLLGSPLWRLEFAEEELCVAQSGEQLYLVLFTSPERARAFLAGQEDEPSTTTLSLFSESQTQFRQAAGVAVEDGLHGAVIDPGADGQVSVIVEFAPPGFQ